MEYLKELAGRIDFGSWQSWSTQQRVLAAIVCLAVVYAVIRIVVPAMLRLLRPALFVVIALIAVWALGYFAVDIVLSGAQYRAKMAEAISGFFARVPA